LLRLIIVSNRLPITVNVNAEGKFTYKESVGGLVSGIKAYIESLRGSSSSDMDYLWFGWPGLSVTENEQEKLNNAIKAEFRAVPVFIPETNMDKFYRGFCNEIIWPLFHYFPSYVVYDEEYWIEYKYVNEVFCEYIAQMITPDDIVWIHDYHLMLLPQLLREKMQKVNIGFFLHIPFPSFEVFSHLPGECRTSILNGLLGADLVGFHTHDDTQHFLRSVLRIFGHEHHMGQIFVEDRIVRAETFPMGIDFEKYHDATSNKEVKAIRLNLEKKFADFKVILSIDRLDYTKGIINRLLAYETFLKDNPQWHGKVILMLIVVPSRMAVEKYQQMKKQIDELVGKITGEYSTFNWIPILYQYTFLPFYPLVALYSHSNVALITPLRDGMNLIAKEFISTRTDKTDVLILSEMAGASKELGEAIIINPNNHEEIARALKEALEMPQEEQVRRNKIMQTRLKHYNVVSWVNDFIKNLLSVKEEQKRFDAHLLSPIVNEKILHDFTNARQRLIFLDYDGTLVPYATHPQSAKPDEYLLKTLNLLAECPDTEVVIISGRDKATLQNWFGTLNIGLVAEHGIWIKEKGSDWWQIKHLISDWKPQILSVLQTYVDRLPGSFAEEKEFSVVWHYRNADPVLSAMRVNELIDTLVEYTANMDIQILQGNKIIEVKNAGVNKGTAGMYWLQKNDHDFIMAMGDDWTDEDLFFILPETAYSIRIGLVQSYARFNLLHNQQSIILELLNKMSVTL